MAYDESTLQTDKDITYWVLPADGIADPNGIATAQEIIDNGINVTCALDVETSINPEAPNTFDHETLCMKSPSPIPTTDNFSATLEYKRPKDIYDSNHVLNILFSLVSAKNKVVWIVRRTGESVDTPVANGQRFESFRLITAFTATNAASGNTAASQTTTLNAAGVYSGFYILGSGGTGEALQIVPQSFSVAESATLQLSGFFGSTDVTTTGTWVSLTPSIATISATGLVTGVAAGNAVFSLQDSTAPGKITYAFGEVTA